MRDLWQIFIKFFTSLRLTVVLLALGIVLVFVATLAQTDMGVWGVQQGYFHTFFAFPKWHGTPVFILPGGYLVGGLLLINLIAAHLYRFRLTWKKIGIQLAHAGVILLLVGELLSGLWQEEYQMSIDTGQTKNFAESYRKHELAIMDTIDPKFDAVVAIPEQLLAHLGKIDTQDKLPFRVVVRNYWPNAEMHGPMMAPGQIPGAALANRDIGATLSLTPAAPTTQDNTRNLPAASVELVSPDGGTLGTWLVSPLLNTPQTFDYAGKTWSLSLRVARAYYDFSLTLRKFSHDLYPGTEIPKNYSSFVQLKSDDGQADHDVLIYMNSPLRYQGLTFYQASFANNDQTTILQVVRNPSWTLPYVSCLLVAGGLLVQFGMSLLGFVGRRKSAVSPPVQT